MKRALAFFSIAACMLGATAKSEVDQRLSEASIVFSEIMSAPDKGIPQDLLDDAHCIVIVPGLKKGAFAIRAAVDSKGNGLRG